MTLRALLQMADGHARAAWDHTATLLAKIHNVNCAKRADMLTPRQCHPYYARRGGLRITKENLHVVKQIFRKGKSGK